MTTAELILADHLTRESNKQFMEILKRIESKICYERQQSDILFDRLVQCKAANRALSQKCKELVRKLEMKEATK